MRVHCFCIWFSLVTSCVSGHKPYVYIQTYIFFIGKFIKHNQFLQSCLHFALLRCKKNNNNSMSQPIMDLHWLFLFLYSELDAKAEEQCADSIEEIDRFSRVFPTSAQHFQNAMEIKTNQWRSMSGWPISTQSHLMDIMQVCMFCWFSHGLGTLPESYLKPWEEIHHSQDLKI